MRQFSKPFDTAFVISIDLAGVSELTAWVALIGLIASMFAMLDQRGWIGRLVDSLFATCA